MTPEDMAIWLRIMQRKAGNRYRYYSNFDHCHARAELATGKRPSIRARWRIERATHELRTAIY